MKQVLIKVTVILLAVSLYFMEKEKTSLSDIALDNIDALAAGEGIGHGIDINEKTNTIVATEVRVMIRL